MALQTHFHAAATPVGHGAIARPDFRVIIIDIDFERIADSMSRRAQHATRGPAGLTPLLNVRKTDAAYHAVRRSVLLGHFQPGEGLLEQRIAERLNCSQGTVREALLRLEQDGLVSRRGYQGTVVSNTSVEEAAHMAEMRVQIECAGIRKSVRALSQEALSELFGITEDMDRATRALDFYRCSELDRQFHMTLFRQSGLPGLAPILNRCALHVHRFTYWNAESLSPDSAFGDKHRALLGGFEAGDPEAAAKAIRAHIAQVIERFAPRIEAEVRRIHDGAA